MTTEQMDWLDDERAGRHNYVGVTPESLVDKPPAFREPPAGWYTFGTHAIYAVKLEFSSELDEAGDPLWERPLWPEMHTDEEWALIRDEKNGIRAWGMSGIPEIMFGDPSDEQLAAAQERSGRNGVLIIPEKMRDYLYGNRIADDEEHMHHTREARDQCAAGDHKYAKLLDLAAEREKIAAHDEAEGRPHLAEAIRELIDRPQGETPYFDGTDPEGKPVSGTWTGETTMAEEPIENRLRRAWLNGFKEGVQRSAESYEEWGRWDA